MKAIFTTLIALSLGFANANAADSATVDTKKTSAATEVTTTHALTYQRLVQENQELKSKLANLQNEAEELQSELEYQSMMSNMFAQLDKQKQADREEEMKAELAYNKMMASMFLQLRNRK